MDEHYIESKFKHTYEINIIHLCYHKVLDILHSSAPTYSCPAIVPNSTRAGMQSVTQQSRGLQTQSWNIYKVDVTTIYSIVILSDQCHKCS